MDNELNSQLNKIHQITSSEDLLGAFSEAKSALLPALKYQVYYLDETTQELSLGPSDLELTEGDLLSFQTHLQEFLPTRESNSGEGRCCVSGVHFVFYVEPLIFQDFQYAYIVFVGEGEEKINTDNLSAIHLLSQALSPEVIKMQLLESASSESQLALAKLQGMHNSLELIKDVDLEVILVKLMALALKTMNGEVGSILIYEKGKLVTKTDMGFSDEVVQSLTTKDGKSYLEVAASSEEGLFVPDTQNSDLIDVSHLSVNLTSILSVPLRTNKDELGLLNIINNEANFDEVSYEVLLTVCNLASYALENAILCKEQVEGARLKEAMEIAQEIHLSLLPSPALSMNSVEVYGWSQACDETGGDYYDLMALSDDRLEVVVGDATGHGIGAAQTMLITRSSLRTLYQLDLPLEKVFEILNDRIAQDTSDEKFMTLFCASIDPKKKTMKYCSAGHDGPILIRDGAENAELEATGIPLGMMDGMNYDIVEGVVLEKNDVMILGSDGTWEAMNESNEEFGKDKILQLAKEHRFKTAREINEIIQVAITNFIGSAAVRDDMTLIVIKVN